MNEERRVYFARCIAANGVDMGAIKVGCSFYGVKRLHALSVNEPFDLELIGSFPGEMFEEAAMHCWLRKERIGGEYFHVGGEASRCAEIVAQTGRNPLPMSMEPPSGTAGKWITWDEVTAFMGRAGVTVEEVAEAAGSRLVSYRAHMKHSATPNRKFVAGLTVAAIRKGFEVRWEAPFPTRRAA